MRHMFRAKIHRATITAADLDYEGSVTIDEALMDAAGILEYEQVHVWNVTRGTRLSTYAMKGPRDSGVVCINGAAAHLNQPGDVVILATFEELSEEEAPAHVPKIIHVDGGNRLVRVEAERAGPRMPRPDPWIPLD